MAEYSVKLAGALGLDDEALKLLRKACRLHDIGKIGVSDSILTKPAPLTDQEMQYVRSHSAKGDRILQSMGFLDRARRAVRHHHERWDGKGYPDGLKGGEIPFLSRIMALADAWDAITSGRPYRAAMSRAEALHEIQRGSGGQFDPNMTQVFVEMEGDNAAKQSDGRILMQSDNSAPASGST